MKDEREIFVRALELVDEHEREAFLQDACGENEALRERVRGLLATAASNTGFLELTEDVPQQAPEQTATHANAPHDKDTHLEHRVGSSIGPYKLIEKIGEGGFGIVFLAEQAKPVRRTVAIKVIKPGMDSRQVIARFEAERQALAIMDHPHIARVLDAGTTEFGRPFFVMELVKGIPITDFCDQQRLTLRQRLELFIHVCQAIQHAHSKGVIHRDIKPANVLVSMYDDRPVVKVIDFGIAKATGTQLTERTLHTGFGAVVGSLEYMSPEQASMNQLDVDTRSDIYSLGVLLYELLTGSTPLTRQDVRRVGLLESLRLVREAELQPPSTRLSTAEGLPSLAANRGLDPTKISAVVRGDLDWIVMKALAKKRTLRYETVNGLGEEVTRFLLGEPVQAHPPSLWYRWVKFLNRNWRAASVTAAALVVLAITAGLALRGQSARTKQIRIHSERVTAATNAAAQALGSASAAPIGKSAPWVAARAAATRIEELLELSTTEPEARQTADRFLQDFRQQNLSRLLAEQIEHVVITSATNPELESWLRMDQQFGELFQQQGIRIENVSPAEISTQIRNHASSAQLCDALELWIATKAQLGTMGGPPATSLTLQPLADALLAADNDEIRSGIRRLIYAAKPFTKSEVDAVVGDANLSQCSPRTLSWLAGVYDMAGARDRCKEVFYFAVDLYPDDFMLNFDFAYMLQAQANWTEAVRYFLRCTALRPDVAGIFRGLGNAYHENGEAVRALAAIRRAVTLDPNDAYALLQLADVELAQDLFVEAEGSLNRALKIRPDWDRALLLMTDALMGQARFAEALVIVEKLATHDGELTESQANHLEEIEARCRAALATPDSVDSTQSANPN